MYYLKAKKQHIMWYFTKFCFSFFIILMFWSQIEAAEGKPGNEFRELTCLRIYCYLNLIEYSMTLLYNAFIILLYDKYHKPTQDQINDGIYYVNSSLRSKQLTISWIFNITV